MEIGQSKPIPTWDAHTLCEALGIQPHDRVLEIGGGHNPFLRTDVVVDIDFHSGEHRDGHAMRLDSNKIYVQGDVTALPFKDKSFDWVICIHVLEHVLNPARACDELMRVAQKGFIETPRKWTEYYAGHPTHRWLIDEQNGTLIFEPITWLESPFLNFALPPVWSSKELFLRAECQFRNIPCVQKIWHNTFRYRVTEALDSTKWNTKSQAMRHYHFAKNLLYWMAEPEHALFHAKMAYLLDKNEKNQLLYSTCLMLCGKYADSFSIISNPLRLITLFIAKIILKMSHINAKIFKRFLNFL
ncbi:MAG: class I SAM-dependent methyltransferase [Dissulfuribacterales bacterium]